MLRHMRPNPVDSGTSRRADVYTTRQFQTACSSPGALAGQQAMREDWTDNSVAGSTLP
jgi:hypothetical protein